MRLRLLAPALLSAAAVSLALLAPASADDAKVEPTSHPILWQIEGETPSFLYGTMHVPDERVTTLPPVVIAAIDRCDALFCELPMDQASQMKESMALIPKMMLPQGQTLQTVLPAELYERVSAYLKAKGQGQVMAMMGRMKPWVITMQMGQLEFAKDLQSGKKALDAVIYERAQKDKKQVGGLETMGEQVGVFDALTMEEQVTQLTETMDGLEKAHKEEKSPNAELVKMYLDGDIEGMQKMAEEQMGENKSALADKLRQSLIIDRNIRMADRIEAKMKEAPGTSFYFAVGSLHYPGPQGILKLLEAKGMKLTRLTNEDAAKFPRPEKKPADDKAEKH